MSNVELIFAVDLAGVDESPLLASVSRSNVVNSPSWPPERSRMAEGSPGDDSPFAQKAGSLVNPSAEICLLGDLEESLLSQDSLEG